MELLQLYWEEQNKLIFKFKKNERDKQLLKDWGLKSKNVPVRTFVPYGKFGEYQKNQIPVDESFALKASELDIGDWLLTFNLGFIDPVSMLYQYNRF